MMINLAKFYNIEVNNDFKLHLENINVFENNKITFIFESEQLIPLAYYQHIHAQIIAKHKVLNNSLKVEINLVHNLKLDDTHIAFLLEYFN